MARRVIVISCASIALLSLAVDAGAVGYVSGLIALAHGIRKP